MAGAVSHEVIHRRYPQPVGHAQDYAHYTVKLDIVGTLLSLKASRCGG